MARRHHGQGLLKRQRRSRYIYARCASSNAWSPGEELGRQVKSASRAMNTAETLVGGGRRLSKAHPCRRRWWATLAGSTVCNLLRWSRCPKRTQNLPVPAAEPQPGGQCRLLIHQNSTYSSQSSPFSCKTSPDLRALTCRQTCLSKISST